MRARDAIFCAREYVDAQDLASIARTCIDWHRMSQEPDFWSRLDLRGLRSPERVVRSFQEQRFSQVTFVAVQFCDSLTDAHLQHLPPTVGVLLLDACHRITDRGLELIALRCNRVQRLSFYWNNNVSDRGVMKLAVHCRKLTDLCLSGCHNVTSAGNHFQRTAPEAPRALTHTPRPIAHGGAGVFGIAGQCCRLRKLDLTRLPHVHDDALVAVAQNCGQLEELRLYADSQYSDAAIIAVATRCPHLRFLDCTGHSKLTDEALRHLAKGCPCLTGLVLSWATQITDDGVVAIAESCRQLRMLSLHGLLGITDRSLSSMSQHLHQLRILDVRGCRGVASRSYADLTALIPSVREYVVHT